MIGSAASTKQRLDVDCALADALFERSVLAAKPESDAAAQRRLEALNLIEECSLPTAVFEVAQRAPRLVNAMWRKLFGTRDAYTVIPGVEQTGRTGLTLHHAELALELDGRPAFFAATLRPSRDALGATTSVIVVCVDITDESIARELAVDPNALVWGGPYGEAADYFNHLWLTHVGRETSWERAIHPDELATCTEALARAGGERVATKVEARVRRADGDYRWHRIRLAIASSGSRWFGTAVDIDDVHTMTAERNELIARERAARAEAEEANRTKDTFLAAVSHELRTPLTTMVLWEAVLRDETADATLRATALDAIQQSVLVQSRVVGDMLDISRSISGKLYVDLRPVDVERLVQGALDTIAPIAVAKQIALERSGTSIDREIHGDAVRLRQVLDNLLANAVKFTDPGGRVTVTVSHPGRSIVIEVRDTGRGIAAEFLPRLFEPFSQIIDPATRLSGGLGLGLAIAKRLVELHGGTLCASSPGLGSGATLTATLPAAAAHGELVPLVRRTPSLAHTRVLVIDDDRRVRDALALLLDRAGADVETADSAEMGRTRIAQRAQDAVVCDIAMPIEDGYSFVAWLRSSGNNTVAIALTAHATDADVERALASGFDRHLAKPIDIERLVANIDELVVGRRTSAVP